MLKLLIADDEIKICQLIEYLVDWEKFDIQIIGIVNDGEQAWKEIKIHKPDIVITDIRMPGYDGLSLMEKAKEEDLDISFIIISGYNKFSYAKRAISSNVVNYLVKPINKAELEETIIRIKRNREKNYIFSQEKEQFEKEEKEIQLNRIILNGAMLNQFLVGEEKVLIASGFFSNKKNDSGTIIMPKIRNVLEERFSKTGINVISVPHENYLVSLIYSERIDYETILTKLKVANLEYGRLEEFFSEYRIITAVGRKFSDSGEIRKQYEELRRLFQARFAAQGNFFQYHLFDSSESRMQLIHKDRRDAIITGIKLFNVNAINNTISEIRDDLGKDNNDPFRTYRTIKELCDCLSFGMNFYLSDEWASNNDEIDYVLNRYSDISGVFEWINSNIIAVIEKCKREREERPIKPIRVAQDYIDNHFYEKITLNDVSGIAGFNPSYFSVIFKKETGKSFIDYLTDTRIEYAKKLLIETDSDIFDVAENAGYSDIKYFSLLFKKYTGLSPADFRRMFGQ